MSKRPYSETNYWVRIEGEDVWEDASQYKKYAYGQFIDSEEVAKAYLQYMDEVGYYEDISAEDISIEVLDGRDMMVRTYNTHIEFRPEYYADFEDIASYNEDEEIEEDEEDAT